MASEGNGNDHLDYGGSDGRDGSGTHNWFWRPFDFPGNTFSESLDDNCSLPTSGDEEETCLLGPEIAGR